MVLHFCGDLASENAPICAAPFSSPLRLSLCSHSRPLFESLFSKPAFQQIAPACTSRCTFQAGVHRAMAQTFSLGRFLFYLPPTSCCALLWASEALFLSQPISLPVRAFPGYRSFLFSSSFPGVQVLFCFLFSLFETVVLSPYIVMFRAFLSFQVFEVFCLCSVRVVPLVDIFLIFLWEEVSSKSYYSAILIPYVEYVKNINDKNESVDILYLIREIEIKRFEFIEIKSITCEMKILLDSHNAKWTEWNKWWVNMDIIQFKTFSKNERIEKNLGWKEHTSVTSD